MFFLQKVNPGTRAIRSPGKADLLANHLLAKPIRRQSHFENRFNPDSSFLRTSTGVIPLAEVDVAGVRWGPTTRNFLQMFPGRWFKKQLDDGCGPAP
jgi:hypothetical protein